MMHLMLEKMQQQAVGALDLHAPLALDPSVAVERCLGQARAKRDEPAIDARLLPGKFGKRGTWALVAPGGRPEAASLQRIHVKPVDDQYVVKGRLKGWKKARSGRLEFGLRQRGTGRMQAVVGPGVVVGHGAHGAAQTR